MNNRDIQEVRSRWLRPRASSNPATSTDPQRWHSHLHHLYTEVSIEMSIRVLAEFDPNAPPEAEVAATTEAGEEAIEETNNCGRRIR